MNYELKLAWRYTLARRKSLARFTAFVAVLGIASGVASLIIAQSLARGFADEMRDKILANTAHITIFSKNENAEIPDWRAAKQIVERLENVEQVSPTTYASAVIVGASATSYAILRVRENGVEGSGGNPRVSKGVFSNAKCGMRNAESETADKSEISIGARLAEKLDLKIGDRAEIVTIENQDQARRTAFRVGEIFQTGLYEYDSTWICISPETFAYLSDKKEFAPQILSVSVKDIYRARETAEEIGARLGGDFKIVDWQAANEPLFAALSLERKFAFAIISLIIFIAALNITATLALLVNERRFDIAILQTCGARAKSLILIFLFEGLLLAFTGIFSGVVLGLLACFAGNYFEVVSLSAEVYSLRSIPFHTNLASVALIIFTAFALCLIAAVYPAFKASRVKPLENLRAQ